MENPNGDTTPLPRPSRFWLLPTFGRGWLWLVYLDLVLPALLWVLANLLQSRTLALLFHNYGLYIISTAPVDHTGALFFLTLTGVPGLLLHGYAVARGLIRRDRLDAALCLLLGLLVFLVFFFDLNTSTAVLAPLAF